MNYRHSYHAGSFSDVLKHLVLIALLQASANKNNPFCVIDTHAGLGFYDLFSESANKTQEYKNGMSKILESENPPLLVKKYIYCMHRLNNELSGSRFASTRYYPGSPYIARFCLRPQDRLIACELQPQDYTSLKQVFSNDRQVSVHHLDGFLSLKAFLPPKEKRGVILIDPSYESPNDYAKIITALQPALKRFATGIYAIWYPLKDPVPVKRLQNAIQELTTQPIFLLELSILPELPNRLTGCGMLIINPPWKFDNLMQATLPWLWQTLSSHQQGGYCTKFLKK